VRRCGFEPARIRRQELASPAQQAVDYLNGSPRPPPGQPPRTAGSGGPFRGLRGAGE
jgi:hypothetical protein